MKVRLTITAEPADERHCHMTIGVPGGTQECPLMYGYDYCAALDTPLEYDDEYPGPLRCPECLAGEVVEP